MRSSGTDPGGPGVVPVGPRRRTAGQSGSTSAFPAANSHQQILDARGRAFGTGLTGTSTPLTRKAEMSRSACLLAATENGVWRLGIGDPTPIGWFTVFAYLAVTLACGLNWLAERRNLRRGE